jgi:PKD repeat protein
MRRRPKVERPTSGRVWLGKGLFAGALVVLLLLWLTGCWLFNVAPVASFTASALSGTTPLTVNFSAILSFDEDGILVKFEWDFGDGTSGVGDAVSHTYEVAGTFVVVLRVTDDRGATATARKTLTVTPGEEPGGGTGQGPTATFTATPLSGASPLTVTFNASASSYAGHAITGFFWTFGDGTTGTGMTTVHTYGPTVTTSYNVVLRVIASDNTEDTATKTITVTVQAPERPSGGPTASFTIDDSRVTAPLLVTVDPDRSRAADDREITDYIWRFGDGTAPLTETTATEVTHRYVTDEEDEEFTITLIVIDDEGATDSAERTVVIENEQPIAGFEVLNFGNHPDDPPDPLNPADVGAYNVEWQHEEDDVHIYELGAVPIGVTVWVQSREPAGWVNDLPVPNTPVGGEPDPQTGDPNNYDDENLSYDPEGQEWNGAPGEVPWGFPNAAWGIDWVRVNWGDGDTDIIVDFSGAGNPDNQLDHDYEFGGLVDHFTITVTVFDFLGGSDAHSRELWLHSGPDPDA